jgi:DNA-binding LacI/PurR family transcriptional regulator
MCENEGLMTAPKKAGTRKPSMADVARHAGVSVMTVSNAINRPDIVSDATRERVRASMDALDYRNNLVARSLRLALPRQIGYLIGPHRFAADAYMDQFLHDLAATSERHGRNLTLISARSQEIEACEDLYYGQMAAGFIVPNISIGDPRLPALAERGIPFVAYGGDPQDESATWNWVDTDAEKGIVLAVDHVTSLGHTELAYLGYPDELITTHYRRLGYQRACRERGLESSLAPGRMLETGPEFSDTLVAARTLLTSADPPTAIVSATDQHALAVFLVARELGIPVGTGVAVTGFDDSPVAGESGFGITSVRQPKDRIAEILVDILVGEGTAIRQELLEPELIVRSSTV